MSLKQDVFDADRVYAEAFFDDFMAELNASPDEVDMFRTIFLAGFGKGYEAALKTVLLKIDAEEAESKGAR